MTNEQTSTLVFKDQAGEYYLLPLETLERGRVPADHKAELEQVIAAAHQGGAGDDDVQGYLLPIVVAVGGFMAGYGSVRFGYDVTKAITSPAPLPSQPVTIPVEPEPIR